MILKSYVRVIVADIYLYFSVSQILDEIVYTSWKTFFRINFWQISFVSKTGKWHVLTECC